MKSLILQFKKGIQPCLIVFALGCFAFSPKMQAAPAPQTPDPGSVAGILNTADGHKALFAATAASAGNSAFGGFSLFALTTGNFNTACGVLALDLNNADSNTAVGAAALLFNTSGTQNTASGTAALENNSTGEFNSAVGAFALFNNLTGSNNAANGAQALQSNTTGSNNTADGNTALFNNTTGNGNTALGTSAGFFQTTGSNNVYIGFGVNGVAGESNACYIASIFGQGVDPSTLQTALVDSNGKLGTALSARRFKHDIKPMDKASEAILALKPVIFHYKSDTKNTPCFGLIAEEVAAADPDLIVRDKNGEILSVRYDVVNAMLLNEFLKEHKKTEKLEATVASLIATMKEQAAQIQKVSAQLEASKPASQVVNSNY